MSRTGGLKDQPNRDDLIADYRALLQALPPGVPDLTPASTWPVGKPVIQITEWDNQGQVGQMLEVGFALTCPAPIVSVTVDLLGDGLAGMTITADDLRQMAGMYYTPTKAGTFQLQVRCRAANGETDQTGAVRTVTVR